MVRKCLFILSMAFFGLFNIMAHNAVKMTKSDNTETIFLLSANPKVSMTENTITVEAGDNTIQVDSSNGVRFEFVDYDPTTVKAIGSETAVFKITQNSIEASNLSPSSSFEIFDISGKTVKSFKTDGAGNLSVDISDLPGGVYVFNSVDKKFKFYKK